MACLETGFTLTIEVLPSPIFGTTVAPAQKKYHNINAVLIKLHGALGPHDV